MEEKKRSIGSSGTWYMHPRNYQEAISFSFIAQFARVSIRNLADWWRAGVRRKDHVYKVSVSAAPMWRVG